MVSATLWVVLAGSVGSPSAFDPKAYIETMPVEQPDDDDDDDDVTDDHDDAKEAQPKASAAETTTAVKRAEVTVEGRPLLALRSAFGTIYLARTDAINAKTLAAATCASAKPAPTKAGPDQPLAESDVVLESDIVKAIMSRCTSATATPAPKGKKP